MSLLEQLKEVLKNNEEELDIDTMKENMSDSSEIIETISYALENGTKLPDINVIQLARYAIELIKFCDENPEIIQSMFN